MINPWPTTFVLEAHKGWVVIIIRHSAHTYTTYFVVKPIIITSFIFSLKASGLPVWPPQQQRKGFLSGSSIQDILHYTWKMWPLNTKVETKPYGV